MGGCCGLVYTAFGAAIVAIDCHWCVARVWLSQGRWYVACVAVDSAVCPVVCLLV